MRRPVIVGLGTAVPAGELPQPEAAAHAARHCCATAAQTRVLRGLYRRSGVTRRGSVVIGPRPREAGLESFYPAADAGTGNPSTASRMRRYTQEAPLLAGVAARRALDDAGVAADTITHLLTVSCTGFDAPGCDADLITRLGLPPGVRRVNVGFMGCHGMFNALAVASAFAQTDPEACVLIAAVELCSLHFAYGWATDRVVANAIFGDGAAAVVVRGAVSGPALAGSGSTLLPDTADAMGWSIGDHGFEMTLSPRVPELIRTHLPAWITAWLATHDRRLTDIESWALHPGGPRILDAVAETLGLDDAALAPARGVLADYGNMSSPTVGFVLERLRATGASLPCVALGFGPGLTVEATLLEGDGWRPAGTPISRNGRDRRS
ncbi:MAG: type III polyketide synthase [Phycisphaerales bacterium]|nr:type III polyketide synthase [Phycisphaerae bacterium]NNM26296.1 type III polyketide synthase [Phycisphaerales bacterium]